MAKKKLYDEKVAKRVEKRMAQIEEGEKKKVITGFQELIGEEKLKEFSALLDANTKKLNKKNK